MKTLVFKWTVSRGRDTYGYNICSLWINDKKVSSCNGGGYDMEGTVLAEWMTKEFQNRLLVLKHRANNVYEIKNGNYKMINQTPDTDTFYGMTLYHNIDKNKLSVSLDGACGFSSMERILEAVGYKLRYVYSSKNKTIYTLEEK